MDERVEKVRNALDVSYKYSSPYMEEAKRIFKCYLNVIDEDEWNTLSECRIPLEWSQVETMLAIIHDYIFGGQKRLATLIPEGQMSREEVDRLERALDYMLQVKMDVKVQLLQTLRSALTMPCGYALIEKKTITPTVASVVAAQSEGVVASQTIMQQGDGIDIPSIRNISFFSVFPSPSSITPEDSDYVIIIDFVPEAVIAKGIEDGVLKGDIEKLKEKAKTLPAAADTAMLYARYASDPENEKLRYEDQNMNNSTKKKYPIRIPVVKYYGSDEIIWLVEDEIIYNKKKGKEIYSCPLVKFSCLPVENMWFTPSPLQYTNDTALMVNVFYNSLIDAIDKFVNPPTVYNTSMGYSPDDDIDTRPKGLIKTTGDVGRAITYLNPPPLPNGIMELPVQFKNLLNVTSGLPDAVQGSSGAGIVRGGTNALEQVLATANNRTQLIAETLIHTGFKPMVEKVLALMQMLDGDIRVSYINADGELEQDTVTQDDIRYALRVEVASGKRSMNKFADTQLKLQLLPIMLQMGLDTRAILEWVMPGEDIAKFVPQQGQGQMQSAPQMQAQQMMMQK